MTDTEIALIVGAIVALIGALQGWLVSKTNQHSQVLRDLPKTDAKERES